MTANHASEPLGFNLPAALATRAALRNCPLGELSLWSVSAAPDGFFVAETLDADATAKVEPRETVNQPTDFEFSRPCPQFELADGLRKHQEVEDLVA